MSWSRNLQTNLIGEVIIISLQYLMEDGPELMLQYYFVDKYAGTNYVYPDGTTFSGRAIVVFSSFASLTVAIIGLANLGEWFILSFTISLFNVIKSGSMTSNKLLTIVIYHHYLFPGDLILLFSFSLPRSSILVDLESSSNISRRWGHGMEQVWNPTSSLNCLGTE